MTDRHTEAFRLLHQTKVRLLECGWAFEEECDGEGFDVIAKAPLASIGNGRFRRLHYSDALDDALRFASHAQARLEAK